MIQIGKHQVGDGQKPFIIAEVGSNWSTFDDCKDSIAKAAACGADAVKFQAYDHKALYGINRRKVMPGTLPLEWLPKLKAKADACGIEFMCSAFSPELYEAVDPYVNVHKVASAEMTHIRILQTLRRLGKPVIMSTGASGEADIRGALGVLQEKVNGYNVDKYAYPVILLYCVAAYPARIVCTARITEMAQTFGVPVGYSDHTTDVCEIPIMALFNGAVVIEKHVNFVEATGPDAPHSLSVDEFQTMVIGLQNVKSCRLECKSRWVHEAGPTCEETPMILRHNRRVLAITDIALGQTLQEGVNFGIYRSLKDDTVAAHPFAIDQMVGKPVKRAIKAGDGIGTGDI